MCFDAGLITFHFCLRDRQTNKSDGQRETDRETGKARKMDNEIDQEGLTDKPVIFTIFRPVIFFDSRRGGDHF